MKDTGLDKGHGNLDIGQIMVDLKLTYSPEGTTHLVTTDFSPC